MAYKIELGVKLKDNDIQNQINDVQKTLKPIEIKVDAETKELTRTIKDALKSLTSGTKNALTLDTTKIESSLNEVHSTIKEIRTSLSGIDSGAGMKPLLSSINQISTALDKASTKFDELNTELKTLSAKDFSVNIGVNLGKSNSVANNAAYGNYVRQELYPELKRQEQAITNYLAQYYKTNPFNALDKLYKSSGRAGGLQNILVMLDELEKPIGKGDNLSHKISQFQDFFRDINEMARMQGIDLSPVTSQFEKTADQVVKTAYDIKNGTSQAEEGFEKLKQVIGGSGIDADGLSKQLNSIVTDLGEIKTALQGLSSGVSLEGLTQSFDRLSETIEKLVSNATLVKNALGDNLGTTVSNGGTEKAIQEQKELAQASTQAADAVAKSGDKIEQAYSQISKSTSVVDGLDSLKIRESADEAEKFADRFAAAFSKLRSIQSNLDKIEIGKLDTSKSVDEIQLLERQLESLSAEYNETVAELNAMGGVSGTQWQQVQNQIESTGLKLDQLKAKLVAKVKTSIGTTIADDISKAKSKFDSLADKSDELRQKLQSIDNIKIEVIDAAEQGDVNKMVEAYNRLLKTLKEVQTQLNINKRAEADANKAAAAIDKSENFELNKQKALIRLQGLFGENSQAARRFAVELNKIQKELDECGDDSGLRKINSQMDILATKAKSTSLKTQTFGQRLKKQFAQYSSYLSVASVFMYVEQGLRSMFEQVKLIDSATTELKKVTDETDATYNQFLTNAASRAKEIGTTIDGLVSSTADFARLGYDFTDAQGLAEVANIYAVVGDEIEGVEGATQSLISTMAAFKAEANGMSESDFAMSIVDKMNEVDILAS